MKAFVAPTDFSWFQFLALQGELEEVNFWMPKPWGGDFRVLNRNEPLLFKLKHPYNVIAGGGFYQHYTTLPISLAWETFGQNNGAASFTEVRDSIARLRKEKPAPWDDYQIGCILLAEPFFWSEPDWIPAPPDWHPNIVRGKTYDLNRSVGRHLWEQIQTRLEGKPRAGRVGERRAYPALPGGYGDPVLRPRRIGQAIFRVLVTDAYRRQCAVTAEKVLPALEAAHIRPFSEVKTHRVSNGLLLRADIHRLFDAGYLTVTPDLHVEASGRLRTDFGDGETYLRLHGRSAAAPYDPALQPDPVALRWHNENVYRG